MKENIYLGTMGFGYNDWKCVFYPEGTASPDLLAHYSRVFNTVELDTTFYGTPRSEVIQQWLAVTPPDFRFCAKVPRLITHEKGLVGANALMNEFVEVLRPMGERLGVILIQMPPSFSASHYQILAAFLEELPHDIRFAVEFRNQSWFTPKTAKLLSGYGVCWTITEYPGLPNQIHPTTDFLYIRWIGQHGSYDCYNEERVDKTPQLIDWWEQLKPYLERMQAVYGFFDNDYAGFAPATCNKFKAITGLPVVNIELPKQDNLF